MTRSRKSTLPLPSPNETDSRGPTARMPPTGSAKMFDAVLCHGVIMYVDDPISTIAALGRIAQPGRIVSVITKNAEALAKRPSRAASRTPTWVS